MKHKSTIQKVVTLVHRTRPGFLPLLLVTRMISAGQPFVPIYFSAVIMDMLVKKEPSAEIMRMVLWLISIEAILSLSRWALEHVIAIQRRVLSDKVQQMICEKTFRIDYEILEKSETLDMIKRAEDGMNSRGDVGDFCNALAHAFSGVFTVFYSAILLLPAFIPTAQGNLTGTARVLNHGLSGFLLLPVVVISLLTTTKLNRYRAKLEQDNFDKTIQVNRSIGYYFSFAYEYNQGKYIRLYKMQDMIMKEFHKCHAYVMRVFVELSKKFLIMFLGQNISAFLIQFSGYVFLGLKAVYSLISVGNTLKYVSAYQNLINGVQNLFYMYVEIDVRSKYLAYFYDYMDIQNKSYDGTIPVEKRDDNEYEIEFRDVSFHYPNSEEMVLSHVNETFKLGSKMAVVGRNGAGKSTFIKLLCRLYDPTEGIILLNGIDIRYYDFQEYAKLFSVVFQDFHLFSFSVGENVAASVDYDEEKVLACIEQAGFQKRLEQFENGIHTNLYQLEEEGVEISGGEAQKLAIARALYKDAPWVILDEPTSALDPVSEYEIYKRFDSMVKDKTAIYISHRMSSCRFCDKIFVFDGGSIVQSGSHEELIGDEGGLYRSLWNAQAQYYNAG